MRVHFNGDSITTGVGFPEHLRDQYIYDRLLTSKFKFKSTNESYPGCSNHALFVNSASAIMSKQYDIVFTQWSTFNHVWFHPGPDSVFSTHDRTKVFKYRDMRIHEKEKTAFVKMVNLLNHDYDNIIYLIDYCKILDQLAKLNSVVIVNINGLLPWQDDLIKPLDCNNLSQSLSDYSKKLLDFNNRDDNEVINFFSKLQKKFTELDQSTWVNLFDSFGNNMLDRGPEGHHPGVLSHEWMANKISNYLTTNNIL